MKTKRTKPLALGFMLGVSMGSLIAMPTSTSWAMAKEASKAQLQATDTVHSGDGPARYLVVLSPPPVPSYEGGEAGLRPTKPSASNKTRFKADSPEARAYSAFLDKQQAQMSAKMAQELGREIKVLRKYRFALNAIALELNPAEVSKLHKLPGVKSIHRDVAEKLDTDYGPAWIGAPGLWDGSSTGGLPGTKGEGVVVGVLDSGINMDHPSFAATGGDGYTHVNPSGSGNYKGWCDPANPNYSPTYGCNDKLIGAWDFADASWGEADGPEDDDGHGSHTASTAAGNHLPAGTVTLSSASYSRAISGVAPHANIIAYDVCSTGYCFTSDVVAAIDQAIKDGVDVINESIGIGGDAWGGLKQQAYLAASDAGIVASRSAGNSGPNAGTVNGEPPWVITSGASTHNRVASNAVADLSGGTSPPGNLTGGGFSGSTASLPLPIVYAGNFGDALCMQPFSPGTFSGQIVVCDRGVNARVEKGWNVKQGGAGGMILANVSPDADGIVADIHHLPAVHIKKADGDALKAWLASGTGHQGRITGTTITTDDAKGDIMADFSSRGPHPYPDLLKPDVTNPGVDILAAYRSGAITPGSAVAEYNFLSGTSMSSPHTAGAAALIKALHPTWSPAEIKSALMTTSKSQGIKKEDGTTPADPFDRGAGRVDLTEAAKAGLILDETTANFMAANPSKGGDPKSLNLPSLANGACPGSCLWKRTVKATRPESWTASVVAPNGLGLSVVPATFTLAVGATQQLQITADVTGLPLDTYAFGELLLTPTSGTDVIHFPVAVKPVPGQGKIQLSPTNFSVEQPPGTVKEQILTISNRGTAPLNWTVGEEPGITNAGESGSALYFDNGPLITHPGGGFGGDDASALQTDLGLEVLGFGAQKAEGIRVADDFTIPAGEWTIQSVSFYGFQIGSTTASTIAGANLRIWDGPPGAPGSSVVFGDETTDRLISTDWIKVYRAVDYDLADNSRPVMSAKAQVNTVLPAGTYWLDWQLDGSLESGPWVPPVSILGQTKTGNAMQYYEGAWYDLVDGDDGPAQGLPFKIEGPANCTSPGDVAWLTVSPDSGTLAIGTSSQVTVTTDSTGLNPGVYQANLCVSSNDPNAPLIAVPVSLTVTFLDVPKDQWAYNYVNAILANGITKGCSATNFCPEQEVTREQMAAFLIRAIEGEPAADYCAVGAPFLDVDPASWACGYIKRLKELNITNGCGDGKYCPSATVNREEMAVFLIRAKEGEPAANYCSGVAPFTDVAPASWACGHIKRLQELAITNGCGPGTYCPGSLITRDQMAAFLARAFLEQ